MNGLYASPDDLQSRVCSGPIAQIQIERPMEFKSGADPSQKSGMRWTQSPIWICAFALLLRIAWIVIGHTYKFKSTDDNFGFGKGNFTCCF